MEAKMCHQIREDFVSGMELLDLEHGTQTQTHWRQDLDISGLVQEALPNVIHVLLKDDGAVSLVCDWHFFDRIPSLLQHTTLRSAPPFLAWILVHALETYPFEEVSVGFFPSRPEPLRLHAPLGQFRRWPEGHRNHRRLHDRSQREDARPNCTDQGLYGLHATPEVGHPVEGLRHGLFAPSGYIKANYARFSKLVGQAPLVYHQSVSAQELEACATNYA